MITVAARISLNAGAFVTMKEGGNEGRGACEGAREKRSELASLSEQGGGAEGAEEGREEGESQSAWEGGRCLYSNLQPAHRRSRTAGVRSRVGALHPVGG